MAVSCCQYVLPVPLHVGGVACGADASRQLGLCRMVPTEQGDKVALRQATSEGERESAPKLCRDVGGAQERAPRCLRANRRAVGVVHNVDANQEASARRARLRPPRLVDQECAARPGQQPIALLAERQAFGALVGSAGHERRLHRVDISRCAA
eukprot:6312650-Prymnesium_polylepis.1